MPLLPSHCFLKFCTSLIMSHYFNDAGSLALKTRVGHPDLMRSITALFFMCAAGR